MQRPLLMMMISSHCLSAEARWEAIKAQEKLDKNEELASREDLILNPDTEFDQRFEAVMLDLLDGKHSTQIKPAPGLHQHPEDNDSDDNPTTNY